MDYNQQSKTRMDLVLFLYAAEHICRISASFVKTSGTRCWSASAGPEGRSLTRIAAFMAEYAVFSIAISKIYGGSSGTRT